MGTITMLLSARDKGLISGDQCELAWDQMAQCIMLRNACEVIAMLSQTAKQAGLIARIISGSLG